MTTATATRVTYRKTRSGEWVVFGPAQTLRDALNGGGLVEVTKKSGEVKVESIHRMGRCFRADGIGCAYGYILRVRGETQRRTASYEAPQQCYRGHTQPAAGCRYCFDEFDN